MSGERMMSDRGLEANRLAEAAVADMNHRQALALCLEVQSLRETRDKQARLIERLSQEVAEGLEEIREYDAIVDRYEAAWHSARNRARSLREQVRVAGAQALRDAAHPWPPELSAIDRHGLIREWLLDRADALS